MSVVYDFKMESDRKSVAILGGAFDPVHLGHLSLAEIAFAEAGLDEVWFMPTAQSPLKEFGPSLDAADRVELLEAALQSYPHFKVDFTEIERGGVSFTYDTVCHLNSVYPEIDFSWIIGGDQLGKLDQWQQIEELVKRLRFLVIERPGFEIDDQGTPAIPGLRYQKVSSRYLDISSSQIREHIALGKPVNDLLPKSVNELIVDRKYYLD